MRATGVVVSDYDGDSGIRSGAGDYPAQYRKRGTPAVKVLE